MQTPTDMTAEGRIDQKIEQVKSDIGNSVVNLLKRANKIHLKGEGTATSAPTIEHNTVRWTLAWKEEEITYELNIVVAILDDGTQAHVDRVWVHRHVTTPFDFDGRTPTTHMRRLTSLSSAEIKNAVEAEFD